MYTGGCRVYFAQATASVPFTAPLPEATVSIFDWGNLPEDEIRFRFQLMRSPVSPVFDDDVEAYLQGYLTYGVKETEEMLGRAEAIFPMIEHYLELHGLPEQLKFIPIIESSCIPYAVSTRGAAGLWQFIPSTATHFGLSINQYIDERKDPCKSTEAAVKYLKRLYDRFGSWELALAAYNCGPTRLSRAIRAFGSNDFWKIKDGLPKETQRYIARYLAACYTGTYYRLHGLSPVAPDDFIMNSMAARVYKPISLHQIARVTGLDLAVIQKLNPSFKRTYLPANPKGTFLVLPRESWNEFLKSQSKKGGNTQGTVVP